MNSAAFGVRDSLLGDVAKSDSSQLDAFNPSAIRGLPRYPSDTMTGMITALIVAVILGLILVGSKLISTKSSESMGLQSLYLAVFLDSFGAMCTLPFMGVFIVMFGCTAFESALIAAAFAFSQFVGTIMLGILSDKVDSRLILLCTLFFCSVTLILGGLTTLLPRQCSIASLFEWHCAPYNVNARYERTMPGGVNPAFWSLLAARALAGFFASTVSVIETMISKMSSDEERTGNVAKVMAFFGLGMMGGPVIGGLLYDYGIAMLCYCAGAITMVNVVYAYFTLETSHLKIKNPQVDAKPMPSGTKGRRRSSLTVISETKGRRRSSFMLMDVNADSIASLAGEKQRASHYKRQDTPAVVQSESDAPLMDALKVCVNVPFIFVLILGTFMATGTLGMAQASLGMICLQIYGWGGTQIGFMTTMAGLIMCFVQFFLAGRISTLLGESGSVITGNMCRAALFLIFAYFRNPLVPWVCGCLGVTTGAFIDAPLQTLLARVSPPHSLGSMMGFMQSVRSLGEAVSPLLAGGLMDIDLSYPLVFAAVVAVAGGLMFVPFANDNLSGI